MIQFLYEFKIKGLGELNKMYFNILHQFDINGSCY